MFGESRSLSVTTFGSSTKASFGGESGVVVEVTHIGAPPMALDATQPAGKAGATTPSKFWLNTTGAHGVAVGAAVAVDVAVAVAVAAAVDVAVAVAVAVAIGLGVGHAPQLPLTLNRMCMFANPIAARLVGVVIPQSAALI